MEYTHIGTTNGPGQLNKDMTIDELVSVIARNSRLTAYEIKRYLLAAINAMLADREDD